MFLLKYFKNRFFATALALNTLFLLLFVSLGSCKFSSMDDFFMSSILSGAYGSEFDVHLIFVNAFYGCFLKPFYWLFPSVGWYYIFEVVEVFASFVAITYVIQLRLGKKYGTLFSMLLLSCLAPIFYYEMEFTKNAALLTSAGILLLSLGNLKNRKFLVFGILFGLAGFVMRKDAFYLGTPCLGMLLVLRWFYHKKFPLVNLIAVLCCFVGVACVSHFDKNLYQDEYKYYAEYQGPRAVFGDGRYYDYDAALDEIEERDLHGLDFELLTKWTYYDTEVLTKDSLHKFIGVVNHNHHDLVFSKMPIAVIRELSRSLHETNVWCWIALSVLLAAISRKPFCLVPWCSLCYVIAAYTYLLLLNRVVSHVEASIWIYASVLLIPFFKNEDLAKIQLTANMKRILYAFGILLYALGFWNSSNDVKSSLFSEPPDNRWNAFMLYEKENPDKLLFMDLTAYKRFCTRLGGAYRALEPGRLNHIIPLGFWNVHLPSIKKELHKRGIENPFRAVANPNVLVVHYDKADMYEKFIELHYGYNVEWKNLVWANVPGREFFSFDVTKFSIKGDEFEK